MPLFPWLVKGTLYRCFLAQHDIACRYIAARLSRMLCRTVGRVSSGRRYWGAAWQLHPWLEGPSDPCHLLTLSHPHVYSPTSQTQLEVKQVGNSFPTPVLRRMIQKQWKHSRSSDCSYQSWQHRYFLFTLQWTQVSFSSSRPESFWW